MDNGLQARPVAKRSIVVCPSSLTNNWAAEVRKWLGPERCQVMVVQSGAEAKNQASQWHCEAVCRCNPHHVLLTSQLLLLMPNGGNLRCLQHLCYRWQISSMAVSGR